MNTAPKLTDNTRSIRFYHQQEQAVFSRIPGMDALLNAESQQAISELQAMYPDAAFALMTASNLFCQDRELNAIHLKAYRAILDGEPISHVRFRYDYDLEDYLERHLWDD